MKGGSFGFGREIEQGGGAAGGTEEGENGGADDAVPLGAEGKQAADDEAAAESESSLKEGGVADHGVGGEAEGRSQGSGGENQWAHGWMLGSEGVDGKSLCAMERAMLSRLSGPGFLEEDRVICRA